MARSRPRAGKRLRATVAARAENRCEYCHAPQSACGYQFHLEHVAPKSKQGPDDSTNRALSCASCNLAKLDRTRAPDPQTGKTEALFNPRTQVWEEHFQWSDDTVTIEGLTPIGRATVAALNMNSEIRRQARLVWIHAGLLP